MGKSNTVVSAYTSYRHLQQSCSHSSVYSNSQENPLVDWSMDTQKNFSKLTFSQTTNFRLSRLKEFADDNLKFDENGRNFVKQGPTRVTQW